METSGSDIGGRNYTNLSLVVDARLAYPPPMRDPKPVPEAELVSAARRLRGHILDAIAKAGSGHPGGSFSALEIILALYSGELRYDPNDPLWPERDRFVLSKGHGVPALYAVMAERGFFPIERLQTLRELGSPLQGHPANALLPGIEASTGSLGQGLSVAQGIALAGRLASKDGENPAWRAYVVTGDGELQEGQIWEAALSAPKLGATNLTVFVDWNNGQIDGLVEDVMPLEPLADKWVAFGWNVLTIDGHSIGAIREACATARAETTKPTVVLARTMKGKGVTFMESDTVGWHGKAPNKDEHERARKELA
jgi:transketolase